MRKFMVLFLLLLTFTGGVMNYFAWAQEQKPVTRSWIFRAYDLWIDSGKNRLVAYQVEISYDRRLVKIVGLEGGNSPVYRQPPYHDRQGYENGRIIVAAFTTAHQIAPQGRIRVARIHTAIDGARPTTITTRLMAAASPGGKRIDVAVQLEKASE